MNIISHINPNSTWNDTIQHDMSCAEFVSQHTQ